MAVILYWGRWVKGSYFLVIEAAWSIQEHTCVDAMDTKVFDNSWLIYDADKYLI